MKGSKVLYIMLICLNCALCRSQASALRIYVSDAEDGKNIADATVTLEGFELPTLSSKYNKKDKFYYFDSIPKGYNTVMAYHPEYNEKGFQEETLQGDVKLPLYTPGNVSYPNQYNELGHISARYKKSVWEEGYIKQLNDKESASTDAVVEPTFRYLYEEDPYHIAIISPYSSTDFFGNDSILKVLKQLSLIEVKSCWQEKGQTLCECYGIKDYGLYSRNEYIRELTGAIRNPCDIDLGGQTTFRVYFFRKEDGSRFKRFNSTEIFTLRDLGLKVAAITNLKLEYYGKKKFVPKKFFNTRSPFVFYDADAFLKPNYRFGIRNPQQAFFSSAKRERKMRYSGEIVDPGFHLDDGAIHSVFFVIPEDNVVNATGLGALDIMTEQKKSKGFYFSSYY